MQAEDIITELSDSVYAHAFRTTDKTEFKTRQNDPPKLSFTL